MFNKFLGLQNAYLVEEESAKNDFISLLKETNPMFRKSFSSHSSFDISQVQDLVNLQQQSNLTCEVLNLDATEKPFHQLVQPLKEKCFSDIEYTHIKQMYDLLYPTRPINHISRFYCESKQMVINNEEYLSINSRSGRSTAIVACWAGVSRIDKRGEAPPKIGEIQSFFRHEISLANDNSSEALKTFHTIARVKWYMDHHLGAHIHPTVKLCATVFESHSNATFIPVSRIAGRVATAKSNLQFDYGEDTVLITVPLLKSALSLH